MEEKLKSCLIVCGREDLIGLQWKEFVPKYYVSENGDVVSFSKFLAGRILKCSWSKGGYPRATIEKEVYLVHRVVAFLFVPNPDNKFYVNHKNGIKNDGRASNLEWCTMKENNIHAYETGLKVLPKGKDDKRSKPIFQYDKQGNFIRAWESSRHPQRELGFRQGCIMNNLSGLQKSAHGFVWKR